MRLVGFDPGGEEQFGWCLVEAKRELPIAVLSAGMESHAEGAVQRALDAAGSSLPLAAVGIDSPLFWVPNGERRVDRLVREAIKRAGAPNAGGTVQQVNSLRGACVTQGILAAHLIPRAQPGIPITESHPKALLWLIDIASGSHPVGKVAMPHLSKFIHCDLETLSEHERDAALGALGAWAMLTKPTGWRNLASEDPTAFAPVEGVEYWMPLDPGRS